MEKNNEAVQLVTKKLAEIQARIDLNDSDECNDTFSIEIYEENDLLLNSQKTLLEEILRELEKV